MSIDGEGTNEPNSRSQQTPPQPASSSQQQQQQAQITHQNLNFSINDILSNNHDVNDSSFQSIVQTLSNNSNQEHITPSYAHLPAELQNIFNTNETDDLLAVQGTNSDASILQGNMSSIWDRPVTSQSFLQSSPHQSSSVLITPSPPVANVSTPTVTSTAPVIQTSSTPPSQPIQQHRQEPQAQPVSRPSSQSSQQQPSSTTLLDNITAQLPPERKEKFIQLFRQLQSNSVSAAQFLSQAKLLLGQQQYQQLEDLKNKPSQRKPSASPANVDDEHNKRVLSSQQLRQEDAQRSMPGIITPQLKRAKSEHIPINALPQQFHQPQTLQQQQQLHQLQMQLQQQHQMQLMQQQQQQYSSPQSQPQLQLHPQPQQTVVSSPANTQNPTVNIIGTTQATAAPVFKTPALPGTPGLQIPSRANTAQSSSKPTAPTGAANATNTTSNTTAASGGGGGDRIDYDTLTDVMGYAGVDLKEETEHFLKDGDGPGGVLPDGVDRSRIQDFMNTELLTSKLLKYAKCVNIRKIDNDFVSYMALATQDRIRTVLETMVTASKHRTYDPFKKPPLSQDGHPLFKIQVKQNVKLQLEAIEHVSRQSELDLDPIDEDDLGQQKQRLPTEKGWYSKKSKKPLVIADKTDRKVTVQDAIFVMERDVQGGRGTNQRTLLKAYNDWLS
ncbi:hypothetical protein [Parasitella parasitica]|uniref:Transcription initiation factor TFIID subunit 4 n=1 Tax=Parasitella parasitica TaxID=35722 RepID=A0A0B7MYH1_9FUNG|nr:hypothetical protein [Parasitella parasitica]